MLRTTEDGICCVHLEIDYNAYIWSWNIMRTFGDGIWFVQYNWIWNMLRTTEDGLRCVHLEIKYNAYIWSWNTKRTSGDGLQCIQVQNANIEFKCKLKELKIVQRLILLFCEYQVQIPNRLSSTRWQQRNGPIIHDVTSVKFNKENEIISNLLTCFPRLNNLV